jgi:hypothetical protein
MCEHHSFSSELHGLKVAPLAPAVSLLLFTDDSLLLFKADTGSTGKIQELLDKYFWTQVKELIEINH